MEMRSELTMLGDADTASPFSNNASNESNAGRTLASILTDSIRNDIITGVLEPGLKLRIRELAERYDVGVNPLREALSRLALSGFVEAEDQRGFRVTETSEAELKDITRTRQRLESDAMRLSIEQGDLNWETRVVASFHRLSRIGMTITTDHKILNPSWQNAHESFHDALISGCNSPWLLKFIGILREQTARYIYLSIKNPAAVHRDVAKEHQEMLDAALSRDADKACALLSAHFAATSKLAISQSNFKTGKKK
jgi:DNA-binding GntR family transcriptional regulator